MSRPALVTSLPPSVASQPLVFPSQAAPTPHTGPSFPIPTSAPASSPQPSSPESRLLHALLLPGPPPALKPATSAFLAARAAAAGAFLDALGRGPDAADAAHVYAVAVEKHLAARAFVDAAGAKHDKSRRPPVKRAPRRRKPTPPPKDDTPQPTHDVRHDLAARLVFTDFAGASASASAVPLPSREHSPAASSPRNFPRPQHASSTPRNLPRRQHASSSSSPVAARLSSRAANPTLKAQHPEMSAGRNRVTPKAPLVRSASRSASPPRPAPGVASASASAEHANWQSAALTAFSALVDASPARLGFSADDIASEAAKADAAACDPVRNLVVSGSVFRVISSSTQAREQCYTLAKKRGRPKGSKTGMGKKEAAKKAGGTAVSRKGKGRSRKAPSEIKFIDGKMSIFRGTTSLPPTWRDSAAVAFKRLEREQPNRPHFTVPEIVHCIDENWDEISYSHQKHAQWKGVVRTEMKSGISKGTSCFALSSRPASTKDKDTWVLNAANMAESYVWPMEISEGVFVGNDSGRASVFNPPPVYEAKKPKVEIAEDEGAGRAGWTVKSVKHPAPQKPKQAYCGDTTSDEEEDEADEDDVDFSKFVKKARYAYSDDADDVSERERERAGELSPRPVKSNGIDRVSKREGVGRTESKPAPRNGEEECKMDVDSLHSPKSPDQALSSEEQDRGTVDGEREELSGEDDIPKMTASSLSAASSGVSSAYRSEASSGDEEQADLPEDVVDKFRAWSVTHVETPVPSALDSVALAEEAGVPVVQVQDWFAGRRDNGRRADAASPLSKAIEAPAKVVSFSLKHRALRRAGEGSDGSED